MEYIITGIIVGVSVMLLAAWEYGKYRVAKRWWQEDDLIEWEETLISQIELCSPPLWRAVPLISLKGYQVTYIRGMDEFFDFSDVVCV